MRSYDAGKDYYEVLGVGEGATREEIDRAFRGEARKRHPDGGGSEEDMKLLNEAHEVLRDGPTRTAYDAARRKPGPAEYGSSMAFDHEAASRAGTLEIPVGDEDLVGLCMSAGAGILLGVPLLILVEIHWLFFLWPLRIMAYGAVIVGIFSAHAALRTYLKKFAIGGWRRLLRRILYEALFWGLTGLWLAMLIVFLYER